LCRKEVTFYLRNICAIFTHTYLFISKKELSPKKSVGEKQKLNFEIDCLVIFLNQHSSTFFVSRPVTNIQNLCKKLTLRTLTTQIYKIKNLLKNNYNYRKIHKA